MSNVGWQGAVAEGATAGTTGRGLALEDLRVSLDSSDYSDGSAGQVDAHVSGIGWQGSVSDGAVAGTTGQGRALEALSGSVSGCGRGSSSLGVGAPVSPVGWQGWASGAAGSPSWANAGARRTDVTKWVLPRPPAPPGAP